MRSARRRQYFSTTWRQLLPCCLAALPLPLPPLPSSTGSRWYVASTADSTRNVSAPQAPCTATLQHAVGVVVAVGGSAPPPASLCTRVANGGWRAAGGGRRSPRQPAVIAQLAQHVVGQKDAPESPTMHYQHPNIGQSAPLH